jgi:hypothetical protein
MSSAPGNYTVGKLGNATATPEELAWAIENWLT